VSGAVGTCRQMAEARSACGAIVNSAVNVLILK
jgi:hypothetical protein